MSNRLREMLYPSKQTQIKIVQALLSGYERAECNRSCDTCRNKTLVHHDDRDGNICRCDIRGIESIVNGTPLYENIEYCQYWSREPELYEIVKRAINQMEQEGNK